MTDAPTGKEWKADMAKICISDDELMNKKSAGGISRAYAPIFMMDNSRSGEAIPDERILRLKYLLRPDEVADILRICQSKVYELCAEGVIDFVKIRKSVRIKSDSVRRLMGI